MARPFRPPSPLKVDGSRALRVVGIARSNIKMTRWNMTLKNHMAAIRMLAAVLASILCLVSPSRAEVVY